jgi:hypothetical protein
MGKGSEFLEIAAAVVFFLDYLQSLSEQSGDQCAKQLRGLFEAGVAVDLQQPQLPYVINQKVVSKQLKAILPIFRI